MNEPLTLSNGNESTCPTKGRRFSFNLVILITVGLMGGGAGGVYWWTFGGGEEWWHNAWLPAKAEFRGIVTLDGVPLRGGQLTTWPDGKGIPRSLGFIDQDGKFALHTAIDGVYIEQAFVGRHRISIAQFAQQVGASAPQMTSPAKYSSPDTSGLVLIVDPDSSKNYAEFALKSDSPKSTDSAKNEESESPPNSSAKTEVDSRKNSPSRP